ncbi:hypothetical protein [Spirosoma flavum]|uniref:Uncharacterized protein n=1 Tax=Spirosoma flavum TaxID=2048557 RepID=A0ABW6AI68_9BACT
MLEIDQFPDQSLSLPDLFQQSRNFVSYLEKSTDLRGLCTHVVNEIRAITGYEVAGELEVAVDEAHSESRVFVKWAVVVATGRFYLENERHNKSKSPYVRGSRPIEQS